MNLYRFVFDCVYFTPWTVTGGCVRGKESILPCVLDDVGVHKVVEGGAIEFIGCVGPKKWIMLCDFLQ